MASHHLIDDHLAVLAERLPRHTLDELADGLIETWRQHLTAGLTPEPAARAAVAEFGTPTRSLMRSSRRRRPAGWRGCCWPRGRWSACAGPPA